MRRAVLLPLLALAACQLAKAPAAPSGELAARTAAPATGAAARPGSVDVDLSPALDRLRRAVRRDGDWLRARGDHHDLAADAAGRFRVTARGAATAELALETTAVTRGAQRLAGPAQVRAEGSAVVVARGEVEERLENGAAGVEQRWHLAGRPAGAGDLVVSVRASGLSYAGATAGGLHFGDPARGAMIRYGLATLVDAAGRRTPLATRFAAGAIRITVPGAILDAAAYPAVVDPVIGAERAVDAPPGGFPASGQQVKPSLACLPSGMCLVAWQDQALTAFGGGSQIRATRLAGLGAIPQDPNGIDVDLAAGGADCGPPLVVGIGAGAPEYAVVYTCAEPLGGGVFRRRLKLARVSEAGQPLGSPITLSQDAFGDVFQFAAATDGFGALAVVWADIQQIRFTTLRAGTTEVAPRVPVPKFAVPSQTWWDRPAVAWTGGEWLLAWRFTTSNAPVMQGIAAAFVDQSGTAIPASAFLGSTSGGVIMGGSQFGLPDFLAQPVVAADGSGAALVLTASKNGFEPYPGTVLATRLALGSSDSTAWQVPVPTAGQEASGLSTWHDGTAFQVLIQHQAPGGQGATLQEVPAGPFTLVPGTPPPLLVSTPVVAAGRPLDGLRGAWAGGRVALAWEDRAGLTSDIRAAGLNLPVDPTSGAPLLTTGGADEDNPTAAFSSGTWLVAWEDQRTATTGAGVDVWGALLAQADGTPIGASALHLTTALGAQGGPVAAGGGDAFLVAWRDDRTTGNGGDVYATKVSVSGTIAFPAGTLVAITPRSEYPLGAAFDGTDYHLLFAEEDGSPPANAVLKELRLHQSDLSTTPAVTVATPSDPSRHLRGRLACRSDGCLVAWSEEQGTDVRVRNPAGPTVQVVAAGLTPDPVVTLSAPASSASPFLVAWTAYDPSLGGRSLWVQPLGLDGAPTAAPVQVSPASASVSASPGFAFDGVDHVLGWAPDAGGLTAAWVQPTGAVRAAPVALVPAALDGPRQPVALAGDGEGRTLVAYTVFDQGIGVRAKRVRVRLASYAKLLGDPCATGTECGSGACVEGVCCDTACGGGTSPCLTCSSRNGHGTPGRCTATTGDTCSDGQACTANDRCDAGGACSGTPYACTATQCQASVACDGAGGCTAVDRPNDTPCDDLAACTHGDKCTGGTCGGTAITCAPTQCQLTSACNGTSSCAVSNRPVTAGCEDGDPCTVNDHCDGAGGCTSGPAKVCPDLADPCKGAGTCELATGNCVYVAANEGAACPGGTCQAGACKIEGTLGSVLGMSCGAGPGGGGALLLALLALVGRRARRSA